MKARTSVSSRKAPRSFRPAITALEDRCLMTAGPLDCSFGGGDGKATVAFDTGTPKTDHATATAVQSDGKVVMVGWAQNAAGDHDFAITRLNADGSLDTAFSPGGTDGSGRLLVDFKLPFGDHNDEAYAVTIQDDGKIVVAGKANWAGLDTDMAVVRLNPDGSLDDGSASDTTPGDSFGSGGKQTVGFDLGGNRSDAARAVTMQGDKIVLAGSADTSVSTTDMAVARLTSTGDLDKLNFNHLGLKPGTATVNIGTYDYANAVEVQINDIILAGSTGGPLFGSDMAAARILNDGTLDSSFGNNGTTTVPFNLGGFNYDSAKAMAIRSDGKIVLAGSAQVSNTDYDFAVAQLDANGHLDTANFGGGDGKATVAFNLGGSNADMGKGIALQSDGKILVGGTVQRIGTGDTDFGVARLTATGTLDSTFGGGGKAVVAFDLGSDKLGVPGQPNTDEAAGIALTSGNRVVVAGTVQRGTAGDTDFGVARLLGDPPAAPVLLNPVGPVQVVDQSSFTIVALAAPYDLVKVYRDINNNNQVDAGDPVVGFEQTPPGFNPQLPFINPPYVISVPLLPQTANNFLVTATLFNSESTPANVGTITNVDPPPAPALAPLPDGVRGRVVKRHKKSYVEVRGATSGMLHGYVGPYGGKVSVSRQDMTGDGTLDLVIRSVKNGHKRIQVIDGSM